MKDYRQIKYNLSLSDRVEQHIDEPETKRALDRAVKRFLGFDYGSIPAEDVKANKHCLKYWDGQIIGRYETPGEDIYITGQLRPNDTVETAVIYVSEY